MLHNPAERRHRGREKKKTLTVRETGRWRYVQNAASTITIMPQVQWRLINAGLTKTNVAVVLYFTNMSHSEICQKDKNNYLRDSEVFVRK